MVERASGTTDGSAARSARQPEKQSKSKLLEPNFAALLASRGGTRSSVVGRQAGHFEVRKEGGVSGLEGVSAAMRRAACVKSGPAAVQAELDPLARSLALPAAVDASRRESASAPSAPAGPSQTEITALEEAVRRVSWGGDRRRGVARIELGGEYAGTAITVQGEGRNVAVRIQLGRGADAGALPERLAERLAARGLTVTEFEVR